MRAIAIALISVVSVWLGFGSSEAWAQATRTWVSGVGDDVNPCSRTAPCKTFAGAISKTAAGGEINTLDPGGFGAVTITKSIRIIAQSGVAGIVVAGTNGIVISAGANDAVYLEGLILDGAAGAGLNGILFNSGASLVVRDCKIFGFSQWGILFTPTTPSNFEVANTVLTSNGSTASFGGMKVLGRAGATTVSGILDRGLLANNANGVLVDGTGGGGLTEISIRDSVVSANSGNGIATNSTGIGAVAFVDRTTASHNGGIGISAKGVTGSVAIMTNSSIQNNGTGLNASGGQILSFRTNNISSNGSDGVPTGFMTQN